MSDQIGIPRYERITLSPAEARLAELDRQTSTLELHSIQFKERSATDSKIVRCLKAAWAWLKRLFSCCCPWAKRECSPPTSPASALKSRTTSRCVAFDSKVQVQNLDTGSLRLSKLDTGPKKRPIPFSKRENLQNESISVDMNPELYNHPAPVFEISIFDADGTPMVLSMEDRRPINEFVEMIKNPPLFNDYRIDIDGERVSFCLIPETQIYFAETSARILTIDPEKHTAKITMKYTLRESKF
ncbi:MAG: hypothetical protein KGJ02_05340 [Verrucomicrobiota bacterium]|nr:hypothetical protein [Verrucomicrobiota bacterium]